MIHPSENPGRFSLNDHSRLKGLFSCEVKTFWNSYKQIEKAFVHLFLLDQPYIFYEFRLEAHPHQQRSHCVMAVQALTWQNIKKVIFGISLDMKQRLLFISILYHDYFLWLMPCYFPSKALWELLTERVTGHFTLKLKDKKQMQEMQHVKTIMFVRYLICGAFNALLLILITILHWFAP